jgi:hypothetical protein
MKRLPIIFAAALFVAGCATAREPSYVLAFPGYHGQEWTQTYSAARGEKALQCTLENAGTGARISLLRDPFHSPKPADAARAYRAVMANQGFEISDRLLVEEDGSASFLIEDAARGVSGKVVAVRKRDVDRCVVLIGRWPSTNDAAARADMDAFVRSLSVGHEG